MIRIFLFISFVFFNAKGIAQIQTPIAPGGVTGATQWFMADFVGGASILKSQKPEHNSLRPSGTSGYGQINNHPSLLMNSTSHLSIELGNIDMSSATYFTVYQSKDLSKEQLIWNLEKNGKSDVVLTTGRVADLSESKYMNFTDLSPSTPKINVYEQQKAPDTLSISKHIWKIGKLPSTPKLPVTDFNGLISEILAFDRVLNREERIKVASYLALKYGITLTESNGIYLNSLGNSIWDGSANPVFHHNIAGIGRDDASGFSQNIASSSNYSELLSISTQEKPENNSFLIWGDNDMDMSPAPKIAGVPNLLKRKWLISPSGTNHSVQTKLVLDTRQIYAPLPIKPVYWLAIDTTGIGDFTAPGIQYVKMDKVDKNGLAHFNNSWNISSSSNNLFTFIVGQDLLLAANVIEPTCANPEEGQLQVKILGGHPPYNLMITNNKGNQIYRTLEEINEVNNLSGITAGKYHLKVTDNSQQVYVDSFYVNNADAPKPIALSTVYELNEGKTLRISATEQMDNDISYHWEGPGSFISDDPVINIQQVGEYTLTSSKDGCSYIQAIQVVLPPSSLFNFTSVYPNPSKGTFNVKVSLNEPAPVSLLIYDTQGKLVLSNRKKVSETYQFTSTLKNHGIYYVVLRAGTSVTTNKLVISK